MEIETVIKLKAETKPKLDTLVSLQKELEKKYSCCTESIKSQSINEKEMIIKFISRIKECESYETVYDCLNTKALVLVRHYNLSIEKFEVNVVGI